MTNTTQSKSELKSTNIPWLGDIPADWEVRRLKMLSNIKRGASPRPIDDKKYFDEDGEFAWVRISDVTASNIYLENSDQQLSELGASLSVKQFPGDLFLSIAGTVGKPIIAKIKCCIHDGFVTFSRLNSNVDKMFLFYILNSGQAYFGLGKEGSQLNLNIDTVGNISIPLPPLSAQKAIVEYLDTKTNLISQFISDKHTMITRLKEQKQSLIHNAVTKGISKNSELKPTNIPWLDDIPADWEVRRLKQVCKLTDGTHDTPKYLDYDEGFSLVTTKDLKDGNIVFDECKYISEEDYLDINKRSNVENGDIIMPMIGTIGGCVIVNTNNKFSVKNLAIFKTSKSNSIVETKFLWYVMDSSVVKTQFIITSKGNVQDFVSQEIINNLQIPLPPLTTQKAIVEYLDIETAKIDTLIDTITQEIELTREYKQSLIYKAVTGKISVG